MTLQTLQNHLRSLFQVEEPSVDRIVLGDPMSEVTGIATVWMPTWAALRQAHALGINTLVVHEPLFYTHWDLDRPGGDWKDAPEMAREAYQRTAWAKQTWMQDQGISVIRCHDVLDAVPGWGVVDALVEHLGWQHAARHPGTGRWGAYFRAVDLPVQPAMAVAQHLAQSLSTLGQPGVAFYGDPERPVRRVGLGTGCICDPLQAADLQADLYLAIDDSVRTWIHGTYAQDSGCPLVVINHGSAEEPGVRSLAQKLALEFPSERVVHLPQGCGYHWVTEHNQA